MAKITKDEFYRQMFELGSFKALANNVKSGAITPKGAEEIADNIFDFIFGKLEEAEKEIQRLSSVVVRLKSTARAGKIARGGTAHSWLPKEKVINDLVNDLKALHGWMISLYETDLTIIDVIDPSAVRDQPQKMADAMNKVRAERQKLLAHGTHFPEYFR